MGQAGYGDSGAPQQGEVSQEQKADANADLHGSQAAAATLDKDEIIETPDEGFVAYVAAEEYANSRHLVKAGEPTKAPPTAGSVAGIIPLITREGDIWAKFVSGVMVTDVPEVIEWCAEHTTICRRSDDPMTKSWATLKNLQARKANREALLDKSEMDADAAFPAGLVDGLKEQAAKSGSAGSNIVESAEVARQVIQERAAGSSQ